MELSQFHSKGLLAKESLHPRLFLLKQQDTLFLHSYKVETVDFDYKIPQTSNSMETLVTENNDDLPKSPTIHL